MKITRSKLKQIIKEELDAAMKEGGVAANMSSEREEDYLPMISSNRPVSSFNRKELKMALAEIPKLKNPAYADALGQHGNQWIEDVYIRAAEMGLYTPPTGADLRRRKGLPDPMKEGGPAGHYKTKQSIKATIKPIGRMTRYILKTLNYDEDRDVDYGIPGEDPGFVDDKQWAELKNLVQTTLSKIPKAARADAMYDEIMTNIQKPRLHRTEIADFASAFDEYFIGLEAMVRDGDLK